jgi:hypothetical protein
MSMKGQNASKSPDALVVNIAPDVCRTPMGGTMVAVPYNILGRLENAIGAPTNQRFNGNPALRWRAASRRWRAIHPFAYDKGMQNIFQMVLCLLRTYDGAAKLRCSYPEGWKPFLVRDLGRLTLIDAPGFWTPDRKALFVGRPESFTIRVVHLRATTEEPLGCLTQLNDRAVRQLAHRVQERTISLNEQEVMEQDNVLQKLVVYIPVGNHW